MALVRKDGGLFLGSSQQSALSQIGAQIIGPEFGDKRCIRLAQLIERAFRSFVPPPKFAASP